MAREMVLAGVSKEELQPDNTPQEPLTPKQKWQNFWFYYKWWVLAAVALIVMITIGVWQMLTTVQPDYLFVMVTRDVISDSCIESLEEDLGKCAEDLNGDGKIYVEVENLPLAQYAGGTKNASAEMNSQKLMAYLVSADAMGYIFDEVCFDDYLAELKESADNGIFFDELNVSDSGYEPTEHYWNWENNPKSSTYWGVEMPKQLYFGVRILGGTASGEGPTKRHDTCKKLLEEYITQSAKTK